MKDLPTLSVLFGGERGRIDINRLEPTKKDYNVYVNIFTSDSLPTITARSSASHLLAMFTLSLNVIMLNI